MSSPSVVDAPVEEVKEKSEEEKRADAIRRAHQQGAVRSAEGNTEAQDDVGHVNRIDG